MGPAEPPAEPPGTVRGTVRGTGHGTGGTDGTGWNWPRDRPEPSRNRPCMFVELATELAIALPLHCALLVHMGLLRDRGK